MVDSVEGVLTLSRRFDHYRWAHRGGARWWNTAASEVSLIPDPTYFHLKFRPHLGLVSVVRQFVFAFYSEVLGQSDFVWQLALATHELLENAVTYAGDAETSIHVAVYNHNRATPLIRLITRNHASEADVEAVKKKIEGMRAATDPFLHYQEEMRVSQQYRDGSWGLGLARVFAEADMRIDYEIDGQIMQITAETAGGNS